MAQPSYKTLKFSVGSTAFTGIWDFSGGFSSKVNAIVIDNATYENTELVAEDVYPGTLSSGTFNIVFTYSAALLTGLNAKKGIRDTISLTLNEGKIISMPNSFISSIEVQYPKDDKPLISVEVTHGGTVNIT